MTPLQLGNHCKDSWAHPWFQPQHRWPWNQECQIGLGGYLWAAQVSGLAQRLLDPEAGSRCHQTWAWWFIACMEGGSVTEIWKTSINNWLSSKKWKWLSNQVTTIGSKYVCCIWMCVNCQLFSHLAVGEGSQHALTRSTNAGGVEGGNTGLECSFTTRWPRRTWTC